MSKLDELLGKYFAVRLLIGGLIASGLVGGIASVLGDLGATEDWVLIYRNWITAGMCIIAPVVCIGFVLITKPRPAAEGSKKNETKN